MTMMSVGAPLPFNVDGEGLSWTPSAGAGLVLITYAGVRPIELAAFHGSAVGLSFGALQGLPWIVLDWPALWLEPADTSLHRLSDPTWLPAAEPGQHSTLAFVLVDVSLPGIPVVGLRFGTIDPRSSVELANLVASSVEVESEEHWFDLNEARLSSSPVELARSAVIRTRLGS